MKFSKDNVEAVLMLGAVGLAGFVAYRLYGFGGRTADAIKANLSAAGDALASAAGSALDAVNPTKNTNLASRGADAVTSAATGRDESFGGWLASLTGADRDAEVAAMLKGPAAGAYGPQRPALGAEVPPGETWTASAPVPVFSAEPMVALDRPFSSNTRLTGVVPFEP